MQSMAVKIQAFKIYYDHFDHFKNNSALIRTFAQWSTRGRVMIWSINFYYAVNGCEDTSI